MSASILLAFIIAGSASNPVGIVHQGQHQTSLFSFLLCGEIYPHWKSLNMEV
jgi:hypothetical protein